MIKLILPALFAGILIGCGGDKPESKNNEKIKTDTTSSDSSGASLSSDDANHHNLVGSIHVGTASSASSASLSSKADHHKPIGRIPIDVKPKVPTPPAPAVVTNPVDPAAGAPQAAPARPVVAPHSSTTTGTRVPQVILHQPQTATANPLAPHSSTPITTGTRVPQVFPPQPPTVDAALLPRRPRLPGDRNAPLAVIARPPAVVVTADDAVIITAGDSVEIEFMDEFDDGEPNDPRIVPQIPPSPIAPFRSNIVGDLVLRLIAGGDADATVDAVIDELIAMLTFSLDRNTGLFNGGDNHMAWWAESRGPELLQHVAANADCGRNVNSMFSAKTKCYLAMMIGTHAPVPNEFKPRDVSVDIGLFDFCEHNKEGIANELSKRATEDPAPYNGWTSHGDGLPDDTYGNHEVTRKSLTDAFAATWLSFCPNLVGVTEPAPRLMVFKHAVYRMQIASLHEGGQVDQGYSNDAVNRATAFPDLVNFLLTDRIQLLRRPITHIRFAGLEERGVGRGIKEGFANEIGKQIFSYSMPTAEQETRVRDQNRELFGYSGSGEYVQLMDSVLVNAERRRSRPVVERYYRAAGRFVGWMLINRMQIVEDLSLMFFAKLMGRKIGWEAIKVYDGAQYRNFGVCLRETDQEIIERRGCTMLGMSAIHYRNNEEGLDVWPTTPEERRNVLNDATTNLVTFASEDEFEIFSKGIYDVIPKHIFECGITTRDLRLLIVGVRTVNATELVETMTFGVGYTGSEIQIVWLKRFIGTLDQKQLQAFVEFATGRRRAGPGGFRAEPINVKRMSDDEILAHGGDPNNPRVPPKSHVCSRQIELPPYASDVILFDKVGLSLGANEFVMV